MSAITRAMRSTTTSGTATVSELWRGYVVEVFSDDTAQLIVPRLGGDEPIGRVPSLVRNLAIGARVIVGAIEGRVEDLVVLSAVSDDGLVIGDARFTNVLLDNAPTDPKHATSKSYVDAQITTRAAASHSHSYSSLTGIPSTFAPSAHTHAWTDVTGKPTTFTPSAHTHLWADITDKPTTFAPAAHSHDWASITSKPTTFTPSSHTHSAADITTGLLGDQRLPARLRSYAEHLNSEKGNDWNNARENGWYMSDAAANAPAAGWHLGYVEAHNDIYVTQTVHSFTIDGASNTQLWRRECQAGTWSAWFKLQLSQAEQDARYAALSHTHTAAQLSDSTATGRSLVTAADAAAARSAIGAGTSSLVIGTTSTTAMAGDKTFAATTHTHAAADVTSGTFNSARLPTATSSAQGAMPAADKTKLDAATSAATASTLALRDSAGRLAVASPSATGDAATKGYVDTGLAGKAASTHTHAISDVTNLQSSLDGKAASSHSHAIADVTGLQTELNGKATSAHSHAVADVTGLQTALDGKAAASHSHAISDVTNLQSSLDGKAASTHTHAIADTTGLQSALDGKAASSHTHPTSDLTGQITNAQLPIPENIPGSADLNNYISTGTFSQGLNTDAASGSNYPEPVAGLLEVRIRGGASMVFQRYTIYNSGKEYTRTKYQSTWYPWLESTTTEAGTGVTFSNSWSNFNATAYGSMKSVKSGGSVTLSGMPKPGTITEGVVLANITAAHRPAKDAYMSCVARTTVPSNVACLLVVRANGNVEVFGAPSTTSYLNIGLSYVQANG